MAKSCTILIFAVLITVCRAKITSGPVNKVLSPGESLQLECSSDLPAGKISWIRGVQAGALCFGYNNFDNTCFNDAGRSVLKADPNKVGVIEGFYICTDPDSTNYRSAVLVLETGLSCGLTTSGVIRGTTVSLPCQFNYLKSDVQVSADVTWSSNGAPVSSITTSLMSYELSVTATGSTTLPAYTCDVEFSFTLPFSYFNVLDATNAVSKSCRTQPVSIYECPTSVTISPSVPTSGKVAVGTTFSCSSNGYPTSVYQWSETVSGTTVTQATYTLPATPTSFSLTCSPVAVNITGADQCAGVSASVSGTSE